MQHELSSLITLLQTMDSSFRNKEVDQVYVREFESILNLCHDTLQQLSQAQEHYESMPASAQATWERLGWSDPSLQEIEGLLSGVVQKLTLLNTNILVISQSNVERMLQRYIQESKSGVRDSSAMSTLSGSLGPGDKDSWRETLRVLRRELQGIGITPDAFNRHHVLIIKTLKVAFDQAHKDTETTPQSDVALPETISGTIFQKKACPNMRHLYKSQDARSEKGSKSTYSSLQEKEDFTGGKTAAEHVRLGLMTRLRSVTSGDKFGQKVAYEVQNGNNILSIAAAVSAGGLKSITSHGAADFAASAGRNDVFVLFIELRASKNTREGCCVWGLCVAVFYRNFSLTRIILDNYRDDLKKKLSTACVICVLQHARHDSAIRALLCDRLSIFQREHELNLRNSTYVEQSAVGKAKRAYDSKLPPRSRYKEPRTNYLGEYASAVLIGL